MLLVVVSALWEHLSMASAMGMAVRKLLGQLELAIVLLRKLKVAPSDGVVGWEGVDRGQKSNHGLEENLFGCGNQQTFKKE